MYLQMDGWMDGCMDRWMGWWMDIHDYLHVYTCTCKWAIPVTPDQPIQDTCTCV